MKNKFLKHNSQHLESKQGYIALISIIIITAVILIISISINLSGVSEIQMSVSENQSLESFAVAEAGISEAMIRLKRDSGYSGGSLNIGNGSCTIEVTSNASNRTITSTGIVNDLTRKIESIVELNGNNLTIISWKEIWSSEPPGGPAQP